MKLVRRNPRMTGGAVHRWILKRYFRGPFVAVLVMLLVFFVVYEYASSGPSFSQTDTSHVVSLIEHGHAQVGAADRQGSDDPGHHQLGPEAGGFLGG